ncbi:MAG: hypothetical protein KME08_15560 [Aphanothece sp. CMT-3BRIN-NPC111]|jgi:heme/copper-type cytochrome/quinol oxidase subunit 2|nr:hypothetical protein [Aphanothece sp. CMT-3BRIN-NPC111]
MPKLTLSALLGFVGLMGGVSDVLAASSPTTVQLTTEPPIEKVVPADKPVLLTLQAFDDIGKPIQNAKIRWQIFTPAKTPWFTTDFPVVEGTQLLDINAIPPTGKLQLQQVLPIRGKYQLLVDVTPLDGKKFTATQQILTLTVPEKNVKYRNLGILAVILLGVGFGGGWVIGERQLMQPGEVAPSRVRLLLSGVILVAIAVLLVVNISAEFAESHDHEHLSHRDHPDVSPSPALEVKWLGDTQATVGQLAQMGVQLSNRAKDAIVKVKATQLEHNETVFVYQGVPDSQGKLMWRQQFFDGAPHKVEVEVSPQPNAARQFSPFQLSKEIEVEAVAPPLYVRFISLAYFTGILVVGLVLGLKLRRDTSLSNTKSDRPASSL